MYEEGSRSIVSDNVVKSRAKTYPWYDRMDPLYEMSYQDGISMPWDSVAVSRSVYKPNAQGILEKRVERIKSPIRESPRRLYSQVSILAMSLIYQYHQLSTLQISSFLGISRKQLWLHLSALHNAGILLRSVPPWFTDPNDTLANGSGSVWSIDYRSWTTEAWMADLDSLEWALLTHGDLVAPASHTPSTIRHNMITAEIILKSLEVCPGVIGSWGDRISGEGVLFERDERDFKSIFRSNVGDGVIVTKDGRAVIIETVGAARMADKRNGSRISDKAAAWAVIASRSEFDLSVVFVNSNKNARHTSLEKYVRHGVEYEARKHIVSSRKLRRGQESIHFVNGYDWFPAPRMIDPIFTTLMAYNPALEEWIEMAPADAPLVRTELVVNTVLGLHTPDWIGNDFS